MLDIYIGCDHAGFALKEILKENLTSAGNTVIDCGTNSTESCDYPLVAHKLCQYLSLKDNSCGILICGTGIGMSMVANRYPKIRAALCTTELQAKLAKRHNNANVLCLGARMIGIELAKAIVDAFFTSSFDGGRHERRVAEFNQHINIK
ncbi:MAG: ribose 5-phosphate isomerase B [Desulfovibrionaceae bacterium]|nr:ribose 5-phosphate isomerase B [Desulfovibrionaceae bacterium]